MSNINISIQELPTVAILSGGLATRLYPVTQKIPKSMIKINGNPFIDYQLKWLKNGILGVGLVLFLYAVYQDRFETSLIFAFTSILAWMCVGLIWKSIKNYKVIGNTLIGSGLIISIAIFFNFGIEPTPFPVGGFIFNNDGIWKALSLLFLFMISGLLFRYIEEIIPEEIIPFIDYEPDYIKNDFQSEDWTMISEDELLREDFEIIKD